MKKFIKLLCIILALSMITALAACGNSSDETAASDVSDVEESSVETAGEEQGDRNWDFSDAPEVNLTFAIYTIDSDPMTQKMCQFLDMVKEYTEGDCRLHSLCK